MMENMKKRLFIFGDFFNKFVNGVRWKLYKSYKNSWEVKIGVFFFLFEY